MSSDRPEDLCTTMKKAAAALRDAEVLFALAGSLAVWARGGPDVYHDVDFVILPRDKDRALEVLESAGFRAEHPPEEWLYKAHDGNCTIDLIFHPPIGETATYIENADDRVIGGVRMPVLQVDDVLVMKLGAMSELYMDYSSLLQIVRSTREQIDWDSVRRTTKGSPFVDAFFTLCDGLGLMKASSTTG